MHHYIQGQNDPSLKNDRKSFILKKNRQTKRNRSDMLQTLGEHSENQPIVFT